MGEMQQGWKRELFVRSYDWKRPPFLGAFLGNGRIGAFLDRTGAGPQDYFYCKGIRRDEGYLAGLFWSYFSVDTTVEHENRGWRQSLDMYHGVLETRYDHPAHSPGRSASVETFICLDRNLIVFRIDPPYRDPLPVNLGVSFSSRGGAIARQSDREFHVSSPSLATVSFRVASDVRPRGPVSESKDHGKAPGASAGRERSDDKQDPFQQVEWNCRLAMMCEGEATLSRMGDNLEASITGPTTIYLLFDGKNGETPGSDEAIDDVRRKGYAQVRREHELHWEDFWKRSYIDSPCPAVERLYVTSLYYLRADAGSYTSIPCPFPLNGWRSGYFWDDTHMHHALLSSNHPELADAMVDHWDEFQRRGLAAKVLAARDPGAEGILLDYFSFEPEYYRIVPVDWYRHSPSWGPTVSFNVTLSPGLSAWRQFSYTGDRQYLKKRYPFIRSIAMMLKTFALQPHREGFRVRISQQTDESYGYGGTENPFAIAAMAKAFLRNAAAAALEMGDPGTASEFQRLSDRMELPNNGWLYLPFEGTEDASSDTLENFFPAMMVDDKKMAGRTLDYYKGRCMGLMGCVDAQAWVKDRAVFPWVHFRAIMGEALLGRHQQAADLLDQAAQHDLYEWDWGFLPQLIHRSGHFDIPLLTPHAMFVSAVNSMFLQEDGGAVRIFAGVPDEWLKAPLGFQLRTSPGALIEARWFPDRGMEMKVEASRAFALRIRKPDFIAELQEDGRKLPVVDGYCSMDIPAGVRVYSLKLLP